MVKVMMVTRRVGHAAITMLTVGSFIAGALAFGAGPAIAAANRLHGASESWTAVCADLPISIVRSVMTGAKNNNGPNSSENYLSFCRYLNGHPGQELYLQRFDVSLYNREDNGGTTTPKNFALDQITLLEPIGSPGVSEPSGIGQFAVTLFHTVRTGSTYMAEWTQGKFEYDFEVFTPNVSASSGLKATRQIAKLASR